MELTAREMAELRYLQRARRPLWRGVPPEKADTELYRYMQAGLIGWTGVGYLLTERGSRAISPTPAAE